MCAIVYASVNTVCINLERFPFLIDKVFFKRWPNVYRFGFNSNRQDKYDKTAHPPLNLFDRGSEIYD